MRKQAILLTSLLLAGAGGAPSILIPAAFAGPARYTVGGSVSGLAGTQVLQNNAGDELKLTADGTFTFATALDPGSAYEVSVRSQPRWQVCSVTQGSGRVAASVTDVAVTCSAAAAQVSTFAGSGTEGSTNGKGRSASFSHPYGLASDKNGGLLVTDSRTRLVRKISPTGDVTTFAGGGCDQASPDGHGTAASFNEPIGLAQDAAGNIYVAEDNANRIRKITPEGDVTTIAGNGTQLTFDGKGLAAMFSYPTSVAADGAGNLYVVEYFGAVVRKITPAGDVSTFAGSGVPGFADGKGRAAFFNAPFGIAVDAVGNLYVADRGNHRIRKITPDGDVTTLAGSGEIGATDGAGNLASFNMPSGLALDSDGNLFVTDTENQLLRKITPAGVVSTLAGKPGVAGKKNGIGAAARFNKPFGVTVDAGGNLYVADSQGHVIRKITPVP